MNLKKDAHDTLLKINTLYDLHDSRVWTDHELTQQLLNQRGNVVDTLQKLKLDGWNETEQKGVTKMKYEVIASTLKQQTQVIERTSPDNGGEYYDVRVYNTSTDLITFNFESKKDAENFEGEIAELMKHYNLDD